MTTRLGVTAVYQRLLEYLAELDLLQMRPDKQTEMATRRRKQGRRRYHCYFHFPLFLPPFIESSLLNFSWGTKIAG